VFAADAVRSMWFGFAFAGQGAVMQQQCMAAKAVESVLAVVTVSLREALEARLRGEVGE
jgi:hypothetical protein